MSKDTLKIVGKKLREIREEKHLTQVDVAEGAGISTNHYAQIERGESNPTIGTLENILRVLKTKSSKVLPF